jgi:spermidine/putrescine transport system ATP-binding protein
VIELRGVSKRFGGVHAVRDVSLTIGEGEIMTLLGPSGSGKTTLLRMIAGFETPDEGTVRLDGKDVTKAPPYRRDVRLVFQSYALFPHLTVEQNVEFGLKMMGAGKAERAARVKEAIALVQIEGKEKRRPSELSGGQRQRVALARALVCRPKVLLLDEPLSALDARLRDAMQVELKKLQQKVGITFVFVTHDQQSAIVLSDRIAVVNEGRIEQEGTVGQIYHRPRTSFVASFIGEANILQAKVMSRRHDTLGGPSSIRPSSALTGSGPMSRGGRKLRLSLAKSVEVIADDDGAQELGPEVTIAIRPEKIHVERAEFEMDGTFPGTVVDEIFRGPLTELFIRTEDGLEVTAVVPTRTADRDAPAKGDRVTWWVHRDDVVVLR